MTTDPIAAYKEALREYEAATRRAERLVKSVNDAAKILEGWRGLIISNTSAVFPAELNLGRTPSFNARNWPTAQALADALAGWHEARHAAGVAFRRVPSDRRQGLDPPPAR